ncbi:MAG: hypothetical protein ABIL06_06985 [Pseudomonadota bacterium]
MKIEYSTHLRNRLTLRGISHDVPYQVYAQSDERYCDVETGHTVATMNIIIYGKMREVMVAYDVIEETVTLLTIHPLKEGQKENRVKSGRWRRLQ